MRGLLFFVTLIPLVCLWAALVISTVAALGHGVTAHDPAMLALSAVGAIATGVVSYGWVIFFEWSSRA